MVTLDYSPECLQIIFTGEETAKFYKDLQNVYMNYLGDYIEVYDEKGRVCGMRFNSAHFLEKLYFLLSEKMDMFNSVG